MTTNTKRKSIILTVLIAVLFASACLGIALTSKTVSASEYVLEVAEKVESSYRINDTLVIPSATFTKDGESIKATSTLCYPDGSEKNIDKITFETLGDYQIKYSAKSGSIILKDTVDFKVVSYLYEVDNPASSVELVTYTFEEEPTYQNTTISGLMVRLSSGSNFIYNRVINLNERTEKDKLFEINIISSETGKFDFCQLNVRLTDIYDENNYIEVQYYGTGSDTRGCYMRASASCQGNAKSKSFSANNKYGTYGRASYCNTPATSWGSRANDIMSLGMNYATQSLYGCRISPTNLNMNHFVDLTDTSLFGEMWDGFTTGEVVLSMYPSRVGEGDHSTSSGIAQFLIRSLDGDVANTVNENYSIVDNVFCDNIAPKVDVDLGEYTKDTLPSAIVNYPYEIYSAKALDAGSGIRSFTTSVKFGYIPNVSDGKTVSIKDGKFTPSYPGKYTILYSAIDYYGNETKYAVDIQCVANSGYGVVINDDGDETGVTGNKVYVSSSYVTKASGTALVNVYAEGLDISGNKVTYSIGKDNSFVPMNDGQVRVVYKATDYVGRTTENSYIVLVDKAETPVFLKTADFYKNIIQGFEYSIPSLTAYDFYANTEVQATVWYQQVGFDAEPVQLTSSYFTPKQTEDCSDYVLKIWYKAKSVRNETIVSELYYELPCLSVYNYSEEEGFTVSRNKLFTVGEGVVASYKPLSEGLDSNYVAYDFSQDSYIEYVNPLCAIDFSVYFAFLGSDFKSMKITLTDAENSEIATSIKLTNNGSGIIIQPLGGVTYTLAAVKFNNLGHSYNFKYDYSTLSFTVNDSGYYYYPKTTINGNDFTGFESNKVYMRIDFEVNVSLDPNNPTNASIAFTDINNFLMFETTFYEQLIYAKTTMDYSRRFYVNKEYVIEKAVCLDAVNSAVTPTVTLKDPNGNVVSDVNGVRIENLPINVDYVVKFDTYGTYNVWYYIPNQGNIKQNINVVDVNPPTLTVSEINSKYSVGDKITITASATDDFSKETQIYISCLDNLFNYVELENGAEYTFKKAGSYKFIIIAYDDAGNAQLVHKVVTVK